MGSGWLQVLSYAPLYIVALAVTAVILRSGPGLFERWNERSRDRDAAKAGDWTRLRSEINRLDDRCAQIELREQECQRNLTDAIRRIGQLEGYNLGVGEAHQSAQRIVSIERESDARNREDKK